MLLATLSQLCRNQTEAARLGRFLPGHETHETEAVEPGDILSLLRLDLLFFCTKGLKKWIVNECK